MFYEGIKENGQEDIVNLVRCARLGSQKYGALVWSAIFSQPTRTSANRSAQAIWDCAAFRGGQPISADSHGGVTEDPDFRSCLCVGSSLAPPAVMRIHGNRGPREIINKAGEVREEPELTTRYGLRRKL